MRLVVVGNPGSRRTELISAAVARRGRGWKLLVVPWLALLQGTAHLASTVQAGDFVRIDSPGRDFEVERTLLAIGAQASLAESPHYSHLPTRLVSSLQEDRGRILWPRQWYHGLRRGLVLIADQLGNAPPHRLLNALPDIEVQFDKTECRSALARRGVPVAPALGASGLIRNWDDLVSEMHRANLKSAFVKLAHGSSASGAIAYRTDRRGRHQAFTTVEVSNDAWPDGEPILYNTRLVRELRDPREIALLVNAICGHKAHAEVWIPKATTHSPGGSFDLRVLVIDGRAHHVVVRVSQSPMTNLHLLNARGELPNVRNRMGDCGWREAMGICERAMACFPRTLCGGVDLLVSSNWRKKIILEVNAFGDLLPGVTDGSNLDPYEAQLAAIEGGERAPTGQESP